MTYKVKAGKMPYMIVSGYAFPFDAIEVMGMTTPDEFKKILEQIDKHELFKNS